MGRQRHLEPACSASWQQARRCAAHRQPAGLIAVGERREQEAGRRCDDQAGGCRSAGGIPRCRTLDIDHKIVTAANHLFEPVVKPQHRGLGAGQWLRQRRGWWVFLEVESGHGRCGVGWIAAKLDVVLQKAA